MPKITRLQPLVFIALFFAGFVAVSGSGVHAASLIDLGEMGVSLNASTSSTATATDSMTSIGNVGEAVEVEYMVPGRLFGIVPVKAVIHVTANSSGMVEVSYPWYTFAMVGEKSLSEEELEALISTEVDSVLAQRTEVQSDVGAGGFTLEEKERVAHSIYTVLEENLLH